MERKFLQVMVTLTGHGNQRLRGSANINNQFVKVFGGSKIAWVMNNIRTDKKYFT